MALKCGIVGLPNVGKSTLFIALTQALIAAANYPFCTIEPNTGIVQVPDNRLLELSKIVHPQNIVPATVEFVDIAGLVEGASKGQGKGNQFLSHIREADAILHVVRCFDDNEIIHVNNKVDPVNDAEIINMELALADIETIEKHLKKKNKDNSKEAIFQKEVLQNILPSLDQGKHIRNLELSNEELQSIKELCLLTTKPMLFVANIDENMDLNNTHVQALQKYATTTNTDIINICSKIEAEIATLTDATEKQAFLELINMSEPGLNRLIRASYKLLELETYFTAGVKEIHAWTIKRNTNAARAAGVIHTDFEKGFIRAEVISFNDFITFKGENGAKEAGKMRLEGRDYIVKDGDIMHFRFNV